MKITQDSIDWKDYFLSKKNMLLRLNWTEKEILEKFEKDLEEHRAALPEWDAHKMGGQKERLINGLASVIYRMKNFPDGEQLTLDN
jgi:uncharacterized Zn finger protein